MSGYREALIQQARDHAEHYRRYDDTESLVDTLVEMANMLAADAEVRAGVVAEEPEWEYGRLIGEVPYQWLLGSVEHSSATHRRTKAMPAGEWVPVEQGERAVDV